jgi:vitamin B12 transporter
LIRKSARNGKQAGTGFKAPSLATLRRFSAFNFSKSKSQPEESEGYDIGFEQPLWEDRVRFGATYFHNEITNLIRRNATLSLAYRPRHDGGSEVSLRSISDRFNVRRFTYTDATDDDTGLNCCRPKHRAARNVATARPPPRFQRR